MLSVFASMCAGMDVCAVYEVQRLMFSVFLGYCLLHLLRKGLSLNPELIHLTSLACQLTLGTPSPQLPSAGNTDRLPWLSHMSMTVVSELMTSCCGKYFTCWYIFPDPQVTFKYSQYIMLNKSVYLRHTRVC